MYTPRGSSTIVFAGGGTGGHLFPSMAIAERLVDRDNAPAAHFVCSDRPLDARILTEAKLGYTVSPVRPLPRKLHHVLPFYRSWRAAVRQSRQLIGELNVRAVVAMGGFVSGPMVKAARQMRVPSVLVNLDAIPGKANRHLAKSCQQVFSVYDTPSITYGRRVALPVRRNCIGPDDHAEAKRQLGMNPDKPMLLITGASQGAASINQAMIELASREHFRAAMADWQILHLAGEANDGLVRAAYEQAHLEAMVMTFCNRMGAAWAGADLAISRCGAGSVAEAVINRCPCIYLPYPYHKDQHQKHNAAPAVDIGGALLVDDAVDAVTNADRLMTPLCALVTDGKSRSAMREALTPLADDDGASQIADALMHLIG